MKSIKTAVVIIVLAAVGYGVWAVLSKKPNQLPPGIAEFQKGIGEPEVSEGTTAPLYDASAPGDATSQPAVCDPNDPEGCELSPADPAALADRSGAEAHGAHPEQPLDPYPSESFDFDVATDPAQSRAGNSDFATAWRSAQSQIQSGNLAQALFTLSLWHDRPELTVQEHDKLMRLLDQLSGTVIYSREFLLEPLHEVRRGERLQDIARECGVPWQFLANINGIDDPERLTPGERLKTVRGPFTAVVSLRNREITLLLGRSYAGRFPVEFGNDPPPREGTFEIREKMLPGDAANPYGQHWLGLGGNLRIHDDAGGRTTGRSIRVNSSDAKDLFAILSQGSRVIIRR